MATERQPAGTTLLESIGGLAPIRVIRSETVLSRLPIHNLSKTGNVQIDIARRTAKGELKFHWAVSYSAKYGPPRQLAYKLDTVVINRRLSEHGRPVPKVLKLGSLREIAQELGLGGDTASVRKALRQNAFAGVCAKVTYHSADGAQRWLEADFTRYSVILTGELLPSGQAADGVHLVFHDPYLEVLNSARSRPLNFEYLRDLPPAAQRFYELASYVIYAALRHNRPMARLLYSDFCTFAPLQRYYDYDHFKKQMYKIHRPHLASGYLAGTAYQDTMDTDGRPDWVLIYTPGPKAKEEFDLFHQIQRRHTPGDSDRSLLVGELTRRGIDLAEARRLVSRIRDKERFLERLRSADSTIARRPGSIANPPGFYVYLLQQELEQPPVVQPPVPRAGNSPATPQDLNREPQPAGDETAPSGELPDVSSAEYQNLIALKKEELIRQYRSAALWSKDQMNETAEQAVRAELIRNSKPPRSA
jgi:hypothetical protein